MMAVTLGYLVTGEFHQGGAHGDPWAVVLKQAEKVCQSTIEIH